MSDEANETSNLFSKINENKEKAGTSGTASVPPKTPAAVPAPTGTTETAQKPVTQTPAPQTPVQIQNETQTQTIGDVSSSGSDNGNNEDNDPPKPSELEMLKSRAKMMGITHSPNIGLEALKAKVQAKMNGEPDPDAQPQTQADDEAPKPVSQNKSLRQALRDESLKLVRLRITNMDPKKKDLPGEILTVANRYIGTIRKFVPYGEQTENGYHVPQCLYEMMKERQFLNIRVKKVNGKEVVDSTYAKEFALEVLPQLTEKELAEIAAHQMARGDEF